MSKLELPLPALSIYPNLRAWVNQMLASSLTAEESLRIHSAKTAEETKVICREVFKDHRIVRLRAAILIFRTGKLYASCTYNSDLDEIMEENIFIRGPEGGIIRDPIIQQ